MLSIPSPLARIVPDHPSPEKATLTVDGQQASVNIKKLKSNFTQVLPEIYVIVDSAGVTFPAAIRYCVSTDTGESVGNLTLQRQAKE